MSLLMYLHEENGFMVMTDTLATTPQGVPLAFTDKCWAFPSMNLLVATTGIKDLGARWVDTLYNRMLARDIVMLDLHAPEIMRKIWVELHDEYGDPGEATSTVYHFGIEEETGQPVRYIYRSADNFETERHDEPGFGIKPDPPGGWTVPDGLDPWIDLAQRVRVNEDERPLAERIHIGGELVVTVLTNDGISIVTAHRFDDYDDQWEAMNAYHQSPGGFDQPVEAGADEGPR